MDLIDLGKSSLYYSIAFIFLNPFAWNIIAQIEYRTQAISGLFCKNKKVAVTLVAFLILILN